MYDEYWGLRRKPFENTPDPDFFYFSREHEEAFLRMIYAVKENKGGAMLTGEYGCGKTTIIRLIASRLPRKSVEMVVINNPHCSAEELLAETLLQLGEESAGTNRMELSRRIGEALFKRFEKGLTTVVFIDEAQLLKGEDVYEDLRLLLNQQLNDMFLVTLFLAGQPELREQVMAYPQLEQRLVIKYHLYAFDLSDTFRYVNHRLKVAGAKRPLFNDEAMRAIYLNSYGVPRKINGICDLALLTGAKRGARFIDSSIVSSIL